jgi:hypothetical protein
VSARIAVLAAVLVLAACGGNETTRQEAVSERGAQVMPFDLDRTTHAFEATDDGGVQTVTAEDADDTEQIALVRAHLHSEAEKFRAGDFGDPAAIHGDEMPGLAALRKGYAEIEVTYAEVEAGARLSYAATDATLVEALHAWFDAQVSDHGEHAEMRQ